LNDRKKNPGYQPGFLHSIICYLLDEELFPLSLFELSPLLLFEDELRLPDDELLLTPLLDETFPLLLDCPDDLPAL
jgi:hypothetical protein